MTEERLRDYQTVTALTIAAAGESDVIHCGEMPYRAGDPSPSSATQPHFRQIINHLRGFRRL